MKRRVITITEGVKEEVMSGCGLQEQIGVIVAYGEVDVTSTVGREDQLQRAGPRPATAHSIAGRDMRLETGLHDKELGIYAVGFGSRGRVLSG